MDVFSLQSEVYERTKVEEITLQDYLLACRDDPGMRATAAERMITAIGEPELVDTSQDQRLSRLFLNRTIKRYPAFTELYGMEETIERIVGFFRHASQGLEERKQILYLLGPVGGGKSTVAEILKRLMEHEPVYVLKAGDQLSPVFESPLGLFNPERMSDLLEDKYNIPRRLLTGLMSPWAVKRLDEFEGDISKFSIVKVFPSKLRQIGVTKTEPGDENNQDVSSLVGKLDIRKLEHLSQNDPDAYSYSGGLNRTTQGLLEFVEMFKAPIKVLHPLLTATQEGSYVGHREHRCVSLSGDHSRPLQRGRVAAVPQQQEQRGVSRPHFRGQGALLPQRYGRIRNLRQAAARECVARRPVRAGNAQHDGQVLGADAPARARKLDTAFKAPRL